MLAPGGNPPSLSSERQPRGERPGPAPRPHLAPIAWMTRHSSIGALSIPNYGIRAMEEWPNDPATAIKGRMRLVTFKARFPRGLGGASQPECSKIKRWRKLDGRIASTLSVQREEGLGLRA
jgi:hypothetical protein